MRRFVIGTVVMSTPTVFVAGFSDYIEFPPSVGWLLFASVIIGMALIVSGIRAELKNDGRRPDAGKKSQ